jgi:putative ABC transport system permease protein
MNLSPFVRQSLRLLRREMRHGIRGFGVFLSCLFLGVFAIAAIGNFTQAARSGLLRDAASLLGGDLELRLVHRPLTSEQTQFISTRATISATKELRTMANSLESGKRTLVELKAVEANYPLYGQVELESGQSLTDALGSDEQLPGIVVERGFLQRLSCSVGSQITIGETTFRIADIIRHEPDRSLRAFNLGPRVMLSQKELKTTGLIQPGSLINYAYRLTLPQQSDTESFKTQLQQRFPEAGWRIRSWREAAPRVRFFLDRMETNLTLLGLCSLLIGGLGISGAVRGYLNGKRNHIATMKCIGATRKLIFTTYLMQILLLGFCASSIGLLAGATLPWALSQIFGSAFPLPLEPGFFPTVWVTSSLFGLLTSLLFSLRELGIACQVTPASLFRSYSATDSAGPGIKIWTLLSLTALALLTVALISSADKRLALWFMLGAGGCILLFRLLAWITLYLMRKLPQAKRPEIKLALANMQRPGAPAAGMIFSLGIGLTALVMIVQVQGSLNEMVAANLPSQAPAYFFFDIQPHQLDQIRQLADNNSNVTHFSSSPTLRGRITEINGVAVEQAKISPSVSWAVRGDRFLSYAKEKPQGTTVTAGQWWPPDYQGPPQISLTADLAKGFGLGLGDNLSVNILGRTVTAQIANIRTVDWSTLELNFAIIFAPGILEQAPQTHIAAVHLPPATEEQFYATVTETFSNISALSVREILSNVSRTLTRIGWAFKGMASIALLTGLLVLIGAVSADQHRRIRDAVIYKVCGATRVKILSIFGCEFIFIGLTTALMSLLVGSLAAYTILQGPLDTDYHFSSALVFTTLVVGVLVTFILGLLGTWKALGHKPAAYLRRE